MTLLAQITGPGEIVIRCGEGFTVTDTSGHVLAGPCLSLAEALCAARKLASGAAIWCENTDLRGRPLGVRVSVDSE